MRSFSALSAPMWSSRRCWATCRSFRRLGEFLFASFGKADAVIVLVGDGLDIAVTDQRLQRMAERGEVHDQRTGDLAHRRLSGGVDLVEQALLRGLEARRRYRIVVELAELARGAFFGKLIAGKPAARYAA
jgi:hypothetical protein